MLLAPKDKVLSPFYISEEHKHPEICIDIYIMAFLCTIYIHMHNFYPIKECLSEWLICDLICVKIL